MTTFYDGFESEYEDFNYHEDNYCPLCGDEFCDGYCDEDFDEYDDWN